MSQTVIAEQIARTAHNGQVDKAGAPYIDHPSRVAARAAILAGAEHANRAAATAWLHDVLEDTAVTAEDLAQAGISAEVITAVQLLTKQSTQTPEDYFAGIRGNLLARIVKTADLIDNTDPGRVAALDDATRRRLAAKYARSLQLLLGAAGHPSNGASPKLTLEIRVKVEGAMEWKPVAWMHVDGDTWSVDGDARAIDVTMPVMTATGQLWIETDPETWARHYPNHLRTGYIYGVLTDND